MTINVQMIAQYAGILVAVVTALVFAVNLTIELLKRVFDKIPGLRVVPTDIFVFIFSVGYAVLAFAIAVAYFQIVAAWYMYVAVVGIGFGVAYIAMFGWAKLKSLWAAAGKDAPGEK